MVLTNRGGWFLREEEVSISILGGHGSMEGGNKTVLE
jgi:hypothetical protein